MTDRAGRLTPVETRAGRLYKREDTYRHPSGVNGAKWRQCQWLVDRARAAGAPSIVTGASVLSPQLAMTAVAASEAGLPAICVVGTTPASAVRHPSPAIAARYGALLVSHRPAYNPALQARVRALAAEEGSAILPYGVTTRPDADPVEVYDFHRLGARQTVNLPPIRTLVIPFGSANSATSILLGLALGFGPCPERIVLVGIGPPRYDWMLDRLERIAPSEVNGVLDHVRYFDLHSTGEVTYTQRVPYTADGIVLHPTYEGKVAAWCDRNPTEVPGWVERDGTACLWIIGGELSCTPST